MEDAELKGIVSDAGRFSEQAFEVLREIAHRHAVAEATGNEAAERGARELIIRCLERRDEMGDLVAVHDALLARVGLFPYLSSPAELSLEDRLAYEAHRPLVEPRAGLVFHATQARVYALLMDGESVILTAPTSFGKTLIVDALIASGNFENVAIVVPTIALIDEVRRRLSRLNQEQGLGFKIVTHSGQEQGDRNIFVLTQERVLEQEEFPKLDLAVIDEMYKLSLDQDERAPVLNQALYKLRKVASQLYLLGPNVGRLSELPGDFEHRFIPSTDSTVAVDVVQVESSGDERSDLLGVCEGLTDPTLIFVGSPGRANTVLRWLVEAQMSRRGLDAAASWLAETYHPDWALVHGLRLGVGLHHGRLPRAIAHHMVSEFNNEKLDFLVCTSTLIEGVNTTAKNIVVLDDKINRTKYDLFTFKNIQGRSGRMFKHFIGRVFLFHPEPQDELPDIDIPVMTQPPHTPAGLLLTMDEGDLSSASRERIQRYLEQTLLPIDLLRQNADIDLDAQLELAGRLAGDPYGWETLNWQRFPTYEQLGDVAKLIFEYFGAAARRMGAFSASQLTLLVWRTYNGSFPRDLILQQLDYAIQHGRNVDDVVLDVLTFQRRGLTYSFPRYLRAVDGIQRAVLGAAGAPTGDYSQFAAVAESGFLPPPLASLDEYGLPLEVARKLQRSLLPRGGDDSLDRVLDRLRALALPQPTLSSFENKLVQEAQEDL